MSDDSFRIGFIPLCDATALMVAVDKGFAAAEGLDVELVREVSWSNVRDKLNIGLFDAAHLMAPVAIASSLGIGHVRVPIVAPFNLGDERQRHHGFARLYAALADAADGDMTDPMVSARALARVVAERKARGHEPLTFGMTFPFSHPQLSSALLDGGGRRRSRRGCASCCAAAALHGGEPGQRTCRRVLRRRALEFGRGRSRHRQHLAFRVARSWRAPPRRCWRCASNGPRKIPTSLRVWCARSLARAEFVEQRGQPDEVAHHCRAPHRRHAGSRSVRTLTGDLKTTPDGAIREIRAIHSCQSVAKAQPARPGSGGVALCADGALGAGAVVDELRRGRKMFFAPDLYDAALGAADEGHHERLMSTASVHFRPAFDPRDIAGYLASWRSKRARRPRLTIVR